MALVVFDSDVLIGFLHRDDAHHPEAVELMREAVAAGTRRWVCTVNYAEILVGPVRAGTQDRVERTMVGLNIETIGVDTGLAERAAAARAQTGVRLPDAFALATAMHAEHRGWHDVRLATFDERLRKAHAELRSF
jgi:predicted nucleic acid-binding protein